MGKGVGPNERRKSVPIVTIAVLAVAVSLTAHAQPVGPPNGFNRYIVTVKTGANPFNLAKLAERNLGGAVGHVYTHALKGFSIQLPPGRVPGDLFAYSAVVQVEPDRVATICQQTVPTGVDRIEADLNAIAKIDGIDERVDVDVAIIDTGIDLDHPDLPPVVGGRHFYSFLWWNYEDDNYDDDNGHGSHVAGIVAALDNDYGVVGVAPGARLWAVKVIDAAGSGYVSDIIKGLDWVTAHADQIEVANVSLAWTGHSPAAWTAIQNSVAAGVVYVVAAGNGSVDVYGRDGVFGTNDDTQPAAFPEVAAISAMADSDGQPGGLGEATSYGDDDSFATFTNFSHTAVADNPVTSPGAAIDLLLPGVGIYSAYRDGGYATMSGTSMASPHAVGLAALHIAQYGRASNASEVYDIRQALINGGVAQNSSQGLATLNDPDNNWENLGCAEATGDSPPSVMIDDPEEGQIVAGTFHVLVRANDDNAVTQVELSIDGGAYIDITGNFDGSRYYYDWDTTTCDDGSRTLRARAADDAAQSVESRLLNVTVANFNTPPVAQDDAATTDEDTPATIDVLANDSDPDGDPLTVDSVTQPGHGTVTNNGHSVTYTPAANWHGSDALTYVASDGKGGTDDGQVTVTVLPVNDPPVAVDDTYSTDRDTTLSVEAPGVLGNDSDVDGDTLTAAKVSDPANGRLTLNADGSFTYTPNTGFNGIDSLTYEATDGKGGTDIATVTVRVGPINTPPVAQDDAATTDEDTPATIDVLANDSDPDGDPLTVDSVTQPAHGTVTNNGHSVIYTPAANWHGSDALTYVASDGRGGTDSGQVTVTVLPVNDPPKALNDAYVAFEDTEFSAGAPGVLGNDREVDGDPLTAVQVSNTTHGTLTFNSNGTFKYMPDLNFNGVDKFTYKANDGSADSNVATVSIMVKAVNDAPVAVDDAYRTDQDTTLSVQAPGVLGNDSDMDGDTLAAAKVGDPANGILTLNTDGSFTYTPNAGFSGTDSFTYEANDSKGGTDTATVTVTVSTNHPPVAVDDTYSTDRDTTLSVEAPGVLGNDSDVDGDTLTAAKVSDPANGTLTLNADGSFTYTPNTGFNGIDSLTYEATDGKGGTDIATVTVRVGPINTPPVAQDDTATTDEDTPATIDVLANDSDPDGDPLTVDSVTQPAHGTVTNNGHSVIYTPAANWHGSDALTYVASDGRGGTDSGQVTVTVLPVNDPPKALNDAYVAFENKELSVGAPGVLGNDREVDGDPLTAVQVSNTTHGTLTFNSNGTFKYMPDLNFNGVDKFTYKANDGSADSNVATVSIMVKRST